MRLLLIAALLLALPSAAHACEPEVGQAADEVQLGAGLSPSTLRSVTRACGDAGPATLVATLVARGSCDHAGQLARSLPGYAGMDGALMAADQCLSASLDDTLAELERVAEEPMPDAQAQSAPRAKRKADRRRSSEASGLLGSAAGDDLADAGFGGSASGYGGLGTRGQGSGGGGRAATGVAPSRETRSKLGRGAQVAYSRLSLGVWFDYNSAALRPEALGTVGALAERLTAMDDGAVLEIAGHTDSTGSWYYNSDLSRQRAYAVQQALILAGVPRSRLTVVGLGEDYPVATNHDAWGRAQNRRVEFRFYKTVAARPVTR